MLTYEPYDFDEMRDPARLHAYIVSSRWSHDCKNIPPMLVPSGYAFDAWGFDEPPRKGRWGLGFGSAPYLMTLQAVDRLLQITTSRGGILCLHACDLANVMMHEQSRMQAELTGARSKKPPIPGSPILRRILSLEDAGLVQLDPSPSLHDWHPTLDKQLRSKLRELEPEARTFSGVLAAWPHEFGADGGTLATDEVPDILSLRPQCK